MLTLSADTGSLGNVETVLNKAKERHERRHAGDFGIRRVADIDLRFDDGTHEYWATVDGRDCVLSTKAFRGACSLIGASKSFFDGFDDPEEFVRQFRKRIDQGKGSSRTGLKAILRTTRFDSHGQIDAVLPPNYRILDDHELLSPIVEKMKDSGQPIHGISVNPSHTGETDYRLLYGEPLADGQVLGRKDDAVYPVVHVHNDEIGFECGMSFGNWRSICSNVCLAGQWKGLGTATLPQSLQPPGIKWNHVSRPDAFFSKAAGIVHRADHYSAILRDRLPVSMATKVPADSGFLLDLLIDRHLIPRTARKPIFEQMRCEAVETEWEWVNVNTFTAQKFEPKVRRAIESVGHVVLLNGFEKLLVFLDGKKVDSEVN